MEKKFKILLTSAMMAIVIGIMATMVFDPRTTPYTFHVNDFKMVRSENRAERNNEKAYILENLLNNPQEIEQFPLTQTIKQPFLNEEGKHIKPKDEKDIAPRVDLVHSKGAVKDYYKLKMNPKIDAKLSTVTCLPRSRSKIAPEGNFRYKFTTKAENTIYGTIPYSCYVTPDNEKIKNLFETLPGTLDKETGIKTMGQ